MSTPLSLLEALAQVPDPRSRHGRRHPLSAILSLTVLAMLCGAKSYEAIAQFGRDKGPALAFLLGFKRGKTPTKSTFSVLFRVLNVQTFEEILSRWIASRRSEGQGQAFSLDGKTARGSRDGEVPGQHLVAAYSEDAQAVLAQIKVDAKTNEHKAALELLGILPVKGNIFTGDAMFCQREVCEKIIDGGGDYIFTAKDNQPSLVIDIKAGLAYQEQARQQAAAFPPEDPPATPPPVKVATTIEKGHGRIEKRTLRTTTILTKQQDWAGLKQGFEVVRERTEKGKTTVEVVHGITSLSPERADAKRLLELTRGHWGIENRLHYRRDVTMGEDASRIRKGVAPQVMAGLRNSIIHVLSRVVKPSLASAIRTMSNCFSQALGVLNLPQFQ
jgi:predicted transposase YbfD/YdcC